jgi:glycosyltransferase involved in cell wall biosynthesis
LLFCWFGSLKFLPYITLARLLGKPVLVIAGGYDVAAEPSISYGNMRPGVKRFLGRALFRLTSMAVSFSQASQREVEQNAMVPRSRSRLIQLGFDIDRPPVPVDPKEKRPVVLAVGFVDESTIYRKGLLTVARMSRHLPDVSIVIVGKSDPSALKILQSAAGSNVRFTGFVSDEELDAIYRQASVYVQPSIHEGFGCTVAEAMLYGCTPVVTAKGSLPEVVGDAGYYVPPDDPVALASAVQRALDTGPPGSEPGRDRIRRLFPAAARRTQLLAVVDALLARGEKR